MTRRPDGKHTTVDPLLSQLAAAIHPSGGGRGDSSEQPIPVDTRAIDLWATLDTQARAEELDRAGTARGTLGAIITRWETETRPTTVTHLEHVTLDIIDQITNLLDPPPKRRPLRKPCPACDQTWVLNSDGDRVSALTAGTQDAEGAMLPPSEYDVTCSACDAVWTGRELTWLLQVIADTRAEDIMHAS
jgi:hypothetical protein